ncbi:MAG: hypothetical protein JW725_01360 [Candidatus Babeliaceae bacterium]|nr:hypothetical protein [Candidatus Babeliaceae bacterium]
MNIPKTIYTSLLLILLSIAANSQAKGIRERINLFVEKYEPKKEFLSLRNLEELRTTIMENKMLSTPEKEALKFAILSIQKLASDIHQGFQNIILQYKSIKTGEPLMEKLLPIIDAKIKLWKNDLNQLSSATSKIKSVGLAERLGITSPSAVVKEIRTIVKNKIDEWTKEGKEAISRAEKISSVLKAIEKPIIALQLAIRVLMQHQLKEAKLDNALARIKGMSAFKTLEPKNQQLIINAFEKAKKFVEHFNIWVAATGVALYDGSLSNTRLRDAIRKNYLELITLHSEAEALRKKVAGITLLLSDKRAVRDAAAETLRNVLKTGADFMRNIKGIEEALTQLINLKYETRTA